MTRIKQTQIHFTLTLILGVCFFDSDDGLAMGRRATEYQNRNSHPRRRHPRKIQPQTQQTPRSEKITPKAPNHLEPFFQHYAHQGTSLTEPLRNTLKVLTLEKQIHPDQEKKDQYTLLMYAAHFGDIETQKLLLQSGAHLEEVDSSGRTAWIIAAKAHQSSSLLYLKEAGANINHLDSEGRSALYFVANTKNFPLFTQLLLMGVTPQSHKKFKYSHDWIYYKTKNIELGWQLLQNSHNLDEFLYAKSVLSAEFIDENPLPAEVKKYIQHLGQRIYFTQSYQQLSQHSREIKASSEIEQEATPESIQGAINDSERPTTPDGDIKNLPLEEFDETLLPGTLPEESSQRPTCIICLDQPVQGQTAQEITPANCNCFICTPCSQTWIEFQVDHCNETTYSCPGCEKTLTLEYFERYGCTEEQITKLAQIFVERKLDQHPDWHFCPALDCSAGKILLKGESSFYSCFLCDFEGCIQCGEPHFGGCEQSKIENEATQKELEFLVNEGKQAPPPNRNEMTSDDPLYYKGRFRPCYFCGTLVERTIGCNSMNCPHPKCGKKWHWNYGDHRLHPQNTGSTQSVIHHDRDCIEAQYTPLRPPHF